MNRFLLDLFIFSFAIHFVKLQDIRYFENSKLVIQEDQVDVTINGDNVNFFVIGDFGGIPFYPYRTIIEQAISDQMSKMADEYQTHFQLEIGDNFYFEGVTNVTDKRFKQSFEDVFNKKNLYTPWFFLLGNHDHRGNAYAQIEYTNHSKRWIMPDYNYTVNVKLESRNENLISILMIDTVLLCGNTGYDNEYDQPRFNSIHEEILSRYYFQSLEDELKRISSTNVSYILVAGHFPVWSIANVGPMQCLIDRLRPLLHKYKVNAYFCGHEHVLTHITDTYLNATVEYIVTGAANINQNSTVHLPDIPKGSLQFYWSVDKPEELLIGGGTIVLANEHNMTIRYFSTTGKELFNKIIYPRHN